MKKIKFLFFTLLFCFSVPVKADTAFENDDTVLCSFLKENVPENASPIESSLENEYRKTLPNLSISIFLNDLKRQKVSKICMPQMYSPIRKNQIVLCYIRQFSIFKI
jgi:hypothetical protein